MEVQIFQTNPRLRGLLLILIFTFAASGIALAVLAQIQAYHRDQIYLATESSLPVHRSNQIDQKIGTETWKTYRNEEYGFEMVFTDALRNYRAGGVYGTQYSYVPFSVPNDRGYIDLFAIVVYPKAEWYKKQAEDKQPVGVFVAENDDNIFIYQLSQNPSQSISNLVKEVMKV